jgi:hypothetical protein
MEVGQGQNWGCRAKGKKIVGGYGLGGPELFPGMDRYNLLHQYFKTGSGGPTLSI